MFMLMISNNKRVRYEFAKNHGTVQRNEAGRKIGYVSSYRFFFCESESPCHPHHTRIIRTKTKSRGSYYFMQEKQVI